MDYLGTADYLTSPVSLKVEAWTHYDEWGRIAHNAVLKCGQRELDLVKRYATHDFDSVLELYYAKARFYDPLEQRFTAVDPILDPSLYDLREYVQDPVRFVQYTYGINNPIIYVDPLGESATLGTVVMYGGKVFVVGLATWLNTPEGKKFISNSAEIIADGIVYAGNAIYDFTSDVISGRISIVHTIIVKSPADIKATLKDAEIGVIDGTSQTVSRPIGQTIRDYMAKVGCDKDDNNKTNKDTASETDDSTKADEDTASSYEKAKKTGKKAPKHKNTIKKKGGNQSLSPNGEADSSEDLIEDGKVIQRRYYGKNGRAELDIDYTDHGFPKYHKVPHAHEWDWSGEKPTRPEIPVPWE